MGPRPNSSRRAILAGVGATALGSTAGCLDLFQELGGDGPNQLSLDVTTLPADDDTASAQIARQLVDNLSMVGVDATLDPRGDDQALRTVLIDNDYDIFVGRHPEITDPDELRTLLHTRFSEELGWQNPYGVTIPSLDTLLDRQRRESGDDRQETVTELHRELMELQPLSVIAYPSNLIVARTDLDTTGIPDGLTSRSAYLRLEAANPDREQLLVSLLQPTVTNNLNPLIPETENVSAILELIYEPLFDRIDGELVPWLAESVSWAESANSVTATIRLRPRLRWHDGTALTTRDVAFTYEFLRDTTLTDPDDPIPAPRFRGRSSLVDAVDTNSNTELTLEFDATSIETARRALAVPILPRDEWEDRTERVDGHLSTAIEIENAEPIGSGPFVYEESTPDQSLSLSRNEDHFLLDLDDPDDRLTPLIGEETVTGVDFEVAVNVGVAMRAIERGDRYITATSIPSSDVDGIEDNYDGIEVLDSKGYDFFVVGFNTRQYPLGNHQFRQVVARMIDRNHVVETAMDGYADPSNTPLQRTEFMTDEFAWSGESILGPFPGADGEVDPELGRSLFREAGFRYNDDGELLVQQ